MDSQVVLMLSLAMLFIVVLMVGMTRIHHNKSSAQQGHIFAVQCQIGNDIIRHQVAQIRQNDGVLSFKIDDKTVMCNQFIVQEIPKST